MGYLNYVAFFTNIQNVLIIEKICILFLFILNANWFRLLTLKMTNMFKNAEKIDAKMN